MRVCWTAAGQKVTMLGKPELPQQAELAANSGVVYRPASQTVKG